MPSPLARNHSLEADPIRGRLCKSRSVEGQASADENSNLQGFACEHAWAGLLLSGCWRAPRAQPGSLLSCQPPHLARVRLLTALAWKPPQNSV